MKARSGFRAMRMKSGCREKSAAQPLLSSSRRLCFIPFMIAALVLPHAVKAEWARATGGSVHYWEDPETTTLWRIHSFTNTGTHQLDVEIPGNMEYLVVAGGGGGGRGRSGTDGAGGGGAGGLLAGVTNVATIGEITVVVGAGGAGGTSTAGGGMQGTDSFLGAIVATGGGGGGGLTGNASAFHSPTTGGSGGGAWQGSGNASGIDGQGNSGGTGMNLTNGNRGGGGGGGFEGAGGNAENISGGRGGDGGAGFESAITGTLTVYAVGGGGGTQGAGTPGSGHPDGGGEGGANAAGSAGRPNTGSGGGGGNGAGGGAGGSGIVVVRYRVPEMQVLYDGVEVPVASTNTLPLTGVNDVVERTFVVTNSPAGVVLLLTNSPNAVVFAESGSDTYGGFSVDPNITGTATNVAPGESTSFTISFSTNVVGSYTGTVSIASNDPAKNPYTFAVAVTVQHPPAVATNAGAVAQGATAATLHGELTAGVSADAYIVWGTQEGDSAGTNDWQNVIPVGPVLEGAPFDAGISGLYFGQQYFYMVFATNTLNGGTSAVSDVVSFVTDPEVPWSPAEILEDVAFWLDAADANSLTLEPDDKVSQWNDKSGNDRHVAQGASGSQPTYTGTSVVFNGSSTILTNHTPFVNSIMAGGGDLDFFIVAAMPAQSDRRIISEGSSLSGDPIYSLAQTLDTDGGRMGGFIRNDSGFSGTFVNHVELSAAGAFNDTLRIYQWRDTGSAVSGRFNGGVETTVTYNRIGTLTLDRFAIGGLQRAGTASHIDGSIREILITSVRATDEERQAMEGYLAHKWGLTANLPSDPAHPYLSAVPMEALNLSVTNENATAIETTRATLHGVLDGRDSVFAVTAYWSTNDYATSAEWLDGVTAGDAFSQAVGTFTNQVNYEFSTLVEGLEPDTGYYFTFRAANAAVTNWAGLPNGEFTTFRVDRDMEIYDGATLVETNSVQSLGTVQAEVSVSRTFTITNVLGSGFADLLLTGTPNPVVFAQSGTTSHNGFTITPGGGLNDPIPPGGSASFTVSFMRVDAGTFTGTVSIASNDTAKDPYTFDVVATSSHAFAEGGDEVYEWYDESIRRTWRIHKFTTVGTDELYVSADGEIEYLIVGGGGGGGGARGGTDAAGGGGGGGVRIGSTNVNAGLLVVVVGEGGAGAALHQLPQPGEASSFGNIVAEGGGRGGGVTRGGTTYSPSTGGSGGGGAQFASSGAAGTSGQGNTGGRGNQATDPNRSGGGGGGADEAGGDGLLNAAPGGRRGGEGGDGLGTLFSGTFLHYGGGGGGGTRQGGAGTSSGGLGGGGTGGNGTAGTNGAPNTGGGGGGGGGANGSNVDANYRTGGDGGSGIVIVRYLLPFEAQGSVFRFR